MAGSVSARDIAAVRSSLSCSFIGRGKRQVQTSSVAVASLGHPVSAAGSDLGIFEVVLLPDSSTSPWDKCRHQKATAKGLCRTCTLWTLAILTSNQGLRLGLLSRVRYLGPTSAHPAWGTCARLRRIEVQQPELPPLVAAKCMERSRGVFWLPFPSSCVELHSIAINRGRPGTSGAAAGQGGWTPWRTAGGC